MQWWGWIIIGALILGAELLLVDLDFFLVFIGISAISVGLLDVAGIGIPEWGEWLLFALFCLLSLGLLRKPLRRMAMKGSEEYDEDPEGEFLALNEALEPGQSCRVNFRGTSWTATNVGETVISQNTRAKISAFKGLTIEVISNENN
ncbi:MAG: hypothetical protein GY916_05470 [Gammaproteobacteria bacterium]|jgi:hypothetical protein|nr:hypothetical protein [Gammaproteobacteria bacterium]